MYKELTCKIVGVAPLLMHNPQLADPMNKFTRQIKAITAKGKKKTDADMEELARLEFMGGLYVNDKGNPIVPGEIIEGMIREGAKKSRSGKDVQCGLISDGNWKLIFDGPRTLEGLWQDANFRDHRPVGIMRAKVMRTRPRFNVWSVEFGISYNPEVLNKDSITKWLTDAGSLCGLMDYRPRFGRFELESINETVA